MYVIKADSINQYIKTIDIENGTVHTTTTKIKSEAMKFEYIEYVRPTVVLLEVSHFWKFKIEPVEEGEG